MIYSEARGCIVDYLGSHEHLAVDIDLSVDEEGGLRLRSGAQRFYEGADRLRLSDALQRHRGRARVVRRQGAALPHRRRRT